MKGSTGDNLLKILELILDNVVFHLGIASSKKMARQIINHGNILVNKKKIDVPRYQVKIGDVITVSDKYKEKNIIKKFGEKIAINIPVWLNFDKNKILGTVLNEPSMEIVSYPINSQLIVEYYSK
jgi:small subunit ribosomal protein S4